MNGWKSSMLVVLGLGLGCNRPPPPLPRATRQVQVTVGANGYTPARVAAKPGERVRLVFVRTTDDGCGQQLALPALEIRKDLPLDTAVAIDVTAPAKGELAFTCGMDMYRGAVVVD